MTLVVTTYGTVAGLPRQDHLAFLGIPYAAPAGGKARFRAPQPPVPWTGVREAREPGYASPQSTHPIPGFAASGPQSEDCLYLSVFTPAAAGRLRPVLFWIHGGGFTHGAGSELLYDGGPLATRGDVVVVTINYRLGALGYAYLGHHLAGAGLAANAGQLDQIAALEWVRDNIAAFGGDPDNITIFGESAGAAAVGTLLAMPAARGLFRRAILESGAGRATAPEAAARITDLLLDQLGLAREEAAKLLDIPAKAIVEAQGTVVAKSRASGGLPFGPVADGVTLPAPPLTEIRSGAAAGIPVLIGTNRDEVKLFASTTRRDEPGEAALPSQVRASVPKATESDARALVETYRASRHAKGLPDTNLDILDAIQTDARFRIPALRMALAQHEYQAHTYAYLFTYASPARHGALGSCHALEMPFVFGTLGAPTQDRFAGTGPDIERLSANMMDAWLSFARTGSPGHEGIGPWPAYDAETRPTMLFDRTSTLAHDPFGEERAALEPFV
jgi:para-nitrobenzyl esterase